MALTVDGKAVRAGAPGQRGDTIVDTTGGKWEFIGLERGRITVRNLDVPGGSVAMPSFEPAFFAGDVRLNA